MNQFLMHHIHLIISEARKLSQPSQHLTSKELQMAVGSILPGELANHALSDGNKAFIRYSQGLHENTESTTEKAGLVFPVGEMSKMLKDQWEGRIGKGTAIYLAATMEYLCAELLELSGNAARDNKRSLPFLI
uniref:Histone H2A n=1 Tax=Arcella intermedia TaxID=1963864 RepID=A0A6B2LMZ8_9EUKA